MKKSLSILTAILMLVCLLTTGAMAADTTETETQEHVHVFNEDNVEIEPTCLLDGVNISVCIAEGCDLPVGMQTVLIPKVDCVATEEIVGQAEATCTEDGYTGDQLCKWCKKVAVEGEVIPALGHTPGDWIVDEELSNDTVIIQYRFCEVCGEITETEEIHTFPFTDVAEDSYCYNSVAWAVNNGITTGTSETTFSPNKGCTRGEIVTFLWRSAGSPEPVNKNNPFTDVAPDAFYYDAVLWAVEEGITYGTTATLFSPNDYCTRAQAVTFLWRANGCPESNLPIAPFIDVTIGSFYYTPVLWAVEKSITSGTSLLMFSPNDTCSRGQIVTFLYRAQA